VANVVGNFPTNALHDGKMAGAAKWPNLSPGMLNKRDAQQTITQRNNVTLLPR
jgi:hypothetical protein